MNESVAHEIVEDLLSDPNATRGFDGVETDKLVAVLAAATEMGYKVLVWQTEKWRWMVKIVR
jgi:hypothetical protein